MKKLIMLALVGLMFIGVTNKLYAQDDSTSVAEEAKDTISLDMMDPVHYEEDTPTGTSSVMIYAIVGGVVIIGTAAFVLSRKKKK